MPWASNGSVSFCSEIFYYNIAVSIVVYVSKVYSRLYGEYFMHSAQGIYAFLFPLRRRVHKTNPYHLAWRRYSSANFYYSQCRAHLKHDLHKNAITVTKRLWLCFMQTLNFQYMHTIYRSIEVLFLQLAGGLFTLYIYVVTLLQQNLPSIQRRWHHTTVLHPRNGSYNGILVRGIVYLKTIFKAC